jgi:6-phosphofructokinase
MVEASIYKRKSRGKEYGVAVISEGLVDLMDKKEVEERWKNADEGHQDLGRHIVIELQNRFSLKKIECTLVARNIGCECRAAAPNADDLILTRDLGISRHTYSSFMPNYYYYHL